MNQNDDCIFCQIAIGSSPCRRLLESENCLAFLDIAPAGKGHTLVIPKIHTVDVFDTSEELLGEIMKTTKQAAELLLGKLKPEGITIFQMNRPSGWQTVFHFHIHVVPRWRGDSLVEPWVETLAPEQELSNVHREITFES